MPDREVGSPAGAAASPRTSPYVVQAVAKTAAVLEAFDGGEPLSLAQLAQRTGMPKPSVFRLASTLERIGLLDRERSGAYVLGMKMISLARDVLARRVPEAAHAVMAELHHAFGHSVNFGVLDRGEIVFAEVLESRNSFRMAVALGTREPLFSTAIGKAIAAYLPAAELEAILADRPLRPLTPNAVASRDELERELEVVTTQGYALDREECHVGAHCVGAPVFDCGGLIGGISISAPSSQLAADELPVLGPVLRDAAIRLSATLGAESPHWPSTAN